MKSQTFSSRVINLMLIALLTASCTVPTVTPTSIPLTATPTLPTPASIPPTETLAPPTPTPIPPTATPVPPTPTAIPSTAIPTPIPPRFLHHTPPELAVDFDVFENAGCPPGRYGFRRCEADSPLTALDCDAIRKHDLLGGLEPSHPIALCLVDAGKHGIRVTQMTDYFYAVGCDEPMFVRYVMWRDDQFHLIKTEDELRAIFAPIATANEALAYAIAVKGRHLAYYDLEYSPTEYEYFVDEIEDTHVETLTDGYLVHLFWYESCGCGYHKTYAVDFHITNQGHIREVKSEPCYRDLAHKCID